MCGAGSPTRFDCILVYNCACVEPGLRPGLIASCLQLRMCGAGSPTRFDYILAYNCACVEPGLRPGLITSLLTIAHVWNRVSDPVCLHPCLQLRMCGTGSPTRFDYILAYNCACVEPGLRPGLITSLLTIAHVWSRVSDPV